MVTGASHYCHSCGHHSELIDGVHCSSCLIFWRGHGRMPTPADNTAPLSAIQALYQSMDWTLPR